MQLIDDGIDDEEAVLQNFHQQMISLVIIMILIVSQLQLVAIAAYIITVMQQIAKLLFS